MIQLTASLCTAKNKKNGDLFVLNSYKDKPILYIKMLGFSKEID